MSTPFDDLIRDAKKVQDQADSAVVDQVQANESKVVKLQIDQMYSGERGDGQEILPRYTPYTVLQKRRKSQPSDRVTLRDTGDFHDAIVIEYSNDAFQFDSTDEKRARLVRKYGPEIFGLNNGHLGQLIMALKPGYIDQQQKTLLND